jgi:hypothetical protein
VSETNRHGRDVFSWDEDYDDWFDRDNAAAANAAAAAAAPLWQQHDWDEDDLLVVPAQAGSSQSVHSSLPALETALPSPPQQQNLLHSIPPHHARDGAITVQDNAPSPTVDEMVL